MTRIPYPDPETLSPAKLQLLGPNALNVSKMWMHTPEVLWAAQRALAQGLIHDSILPAEWRELIVLRTAYLSNSSYEIFHHLSIAQTLGMSSLTCDAMRTGDFAELALEERLIAQFTTEVVEQVSPTDETLAAMREAFSLEQIFEMVVTLGYYMMVARVAALSGIEFDNAPISNW